MQTTRRKTLIKPVNYAFDCDGTAKKVPSWLFTECQRVGIGGTVSAEVAAPGSGTTTWKVLAFTRAGCIAEETSTFRWLTKADVQ